MNHRPKKRFGQNFLREPGIVAKILAAAEISTGESVLEIGPGLGALTDPLLTSGARLLVMEVDRDLAEQLSARTDSGLTVVMGDALALDWAIHLQSPPYKLVANLPYNISSQVLFKMLEHRDCFSRLVLMFQKEVGDRLIAGPGTKDYGVLSVLLQTWFSIKRVAKVPPGAFFPPPKVDSVVLRFDRLAEPRTIVPDEIQYKRLVKGAFAQRRKTLRNSLMGAGWSDQVVDKLFSNCDIDPKRRGETLSIEEFGLLHRIVLDIHENEEGDNIE
jgi:16S rRNA (adenine1518-N6/adenine1519-N6)-dimethyltransferase